MMSISRWMSAAFTASIFETSAAVPLDCGDVWLAGFCCARAHTALSNRNAINSRFFIDPPVPHSMLTNETGALGEIPMGSAFGTLVTTHLRRCRQAHGCAKVLSLVCAYLRLCVLILSSE